MSKKNTVSRLALLGLLFAPGLSGAASGITDPPGDLLATFAGGAGRADLDVTNAAAFYDPVTNMFRLEATMAAALVPAFTNAYVWGVNLGTGTAGFAANGITGVRFNTVALLRANGTGTVAGSPLPAGAVVVSGNMITATFSGSLLTSTGFAAQDYTWNLWPRDTSFAGFAAISDFAPDNVSFTAIPAVIPVPEPGTALLLLLGAAGLARALRRPQTAPV